VSGAEDLISGPQFAAKIFRDSFFESIAAHETATDNGDYTAGTRLSGCPSGSSAAPIGNTPSKPRLLRPSAAR
jgi:hypothetical protein